MGWDSVLDDWRGPGELGMLMLLLCQKRSTSSLILTSQVRLELSASPVGDFCFVWRAVFFLGWEITERIFRKNQVNHQGCMTFFLANHGQWVLILVTTVGVGVAKAILFETPEERDFATPLAGTHLSLHSLRLGEKGEKPEGSLKGKAKVQ